MNLWRFVQGNLQTKLVMMLIGFSFFSAMLVGGVSLYMSMQASRQKIVESNLVLTQLVGNEIQDFIDNSRNMTETLALSPAAAQMDTDKLKTLLVNTQAKNSQFELLYVIDQQGEQIVRTSGKLGNRADREYFKQAIQGKTFLTDIYISATTKQPTITIASPIYDPVGRVVGVLGADISLKTVWDIVGRTAVGSEGYIDIVDKKGVFIAHPDKERVLKQESANEQRYVQKVLQGETGSVTDTATIGDEALVTFLQIPDYQWGVIAYLPDAEIRQSMYQILWTGLGLIFLAVLLAAVSGIYFARSITYPLQSMVEACRDFAKGDFRSRDAFAVRQDGIGDLGSALQVMQTGLQGLLQKVHISAEHVAEAAQTLTLNAEQEASAIQQVANSIVTVAEGSDHQQQAVQHALQIVEDISARVVEAAEASGQVDVNAKQVVLKTKSGNIAVNKAVSQMQSIETTVNDSSRVVLELGNRSKAIGQIVDTISNIAGQTNLLALNAAIEAARAGNQGRGFSVVAEEVRKLAEQSQEAAKQIESLIVEIQQATEQAVHAMESGTREVKTGTEVVSEAGSIFHEIESLVAEVSNEILGVAETIQGMEKGSHQIKQAMQMVEQHGRKSVQESQNVSASTEEQAAGMEEISSSSQNLLVLAQELKDAVSKFKI